MNLSAWCIAFASPCAKSHLCLEAGALEDVEHPLQVTRAQKMSKSLVLRAMPA